MTLQHLQEQKFTVPTSAGGSGFTATQTYTYDDLNRLQSATETIGGTQTWKQTFDIDRYGNREFDADPIKTTTLGSCLQKTCNPVVNTSDNRFQEDQDGDTLVDYDYDANGAVIKDASGQRFTYDAESHQKEFFAIGNAGSTPDGTYQYDGDGQRVKKITNSETTIFVYNASGQLVAEYSTALATTPQVSYLTTDHLGSPRVVTKEDGTVIDRKDYSAFGEESVSSQRSTNAEYSAADQLRKNYTGYEKDSESGLEFAQARYYNPTHGRFTSVDPLTASATIRNPQTFNRYSYVLNSPYKFSDPLGLLPETDKGTCNFECRVMKGINGEAGLTETDLALAKFHIANGSALGYRFLNAANGAIDRQQAESTRAIERINQLNSEGLSILKMILGETLSTARAGEKEYGIGQAGQIAKVGAPNGKTITESDIYYEMNLFIIVAENRARDGGFGGETVEEVIKAPSQFAFQRGEKILNAFIQGKTVQGLPALSDVILALDAIRGYQMPGIGGRNSNYVRSFYESNHGINMNKILYWKATVQGSYVRAWKDGADQLRIGRTDFSYAN